MRTSHVIVAATVAGVGGLFLMMHLGLGLNRDDPNQVCFTKEQVATISSKVVAQEHTILELRAQLEAAQFGSNEKTQLQKKHEAKAAATISVTDDALALHSDSGLTIQTVAKKEGWGPDSFGWNKPPNYQWKVRKKHGNANLGTSRGRPEPEKRQAAFDAHREQRHKVIGPTIKKMAATNKNTIIILLVNSGQMSLFLNFICSCEKRNLAWKEFVFVFALDAKAKVLLDHLGVASYHLDDTEIANAAKQFSDTTFSKVIFFKTAVTYDVLLLGVNVLFQDVDIVWKSSPVAYFQDPARAEVDMFFMKDGNSNTQQPLYANSGFHFNRYNERTLMLWEETYLNAHTAPVQQQVIQPLLIHHFFVNSLRVYILPNEFANGNLWQIPGSTKRIPKNWIVLHASWTSNITHKVKKFIATNEWYAACIEDKDKTGPTLAI